MNNYTNIHVKILEPLNFSTQALSDLQENFALTYSYDSNDSIEKAEVLFVRLGHKIDQQFLERCPKLRIIVTPTTGLDHIDLQYAQSKNISVLSLKGETEFLRSIPATAEHTWGLLLALKRKLPFAHNSVINGDWDRDAFRGNDLSGLNLGLVGFGRVARIVARYATAFNMNIFAYDPYVNSMPDNVKKLSSLDELTSISDVLSVHPLLSDETIDLISYKEFKLMKTNSVLINTSRGDIVNNEALLDSIKNKRISGAAIDVISGERDLINSCREQLINFASNNDNLIITPHLAGATVESMAMTEEFMLAKLYKYLNETYYTENT